MNARLRELELRRDLLVLRSRLLRSQATMDGATIGARFAQVDRGFNAVRSLASSPVVLGVGALIALAVGPQRAVRWAGRGLVALSLARRVARMVATAR